MADAMVVTINATELAARLATAVADDPRPEGVTAGQLMDAIANADAEFHNDLMNMAEVAIRYFAECSIAAATDLGVDARLVAPLGLNSPSRH